MQLSGTRDLRHHLHLFTHRSISLWNATKKKPVYTRLGAHVLSDPAAPPCWISSLTSLRHTDLFASGSSDGIVRLWRIEKDMRSFKRIAEWKVKGVVNALSFFEGPDWDAAKEEHATSSTLMSRKDRAREAATRGSVDTSFVYLAAAVGDEHRLGRWFTVPARNRLVVVKIGKRD
jgi:ribosomal RNA-processing protein 9